MNTITFNSATEFINALEARRPFWAQYDAENKAKNDAARARWLTEARAALHAAAELDDDALIAAVGNYNSRLHVTVSGGGVSACPPSKERALDRVIDALRVTKQNRFRVDSTGAWQTAHSLLLDNPYEKGLCG